MEHNLCVYFKSFPQLKIKPYRGNHFLGKGYCVDTVGLDEEKINNVLKNSKGLDFAPL
jgi:hypothetical protein